MIPVTSQIRHDPENGRYGDCFRACIASILELSAEDVPHVFHDRCPGSDGVGRMREFLKGRGMGLVEIPFQCTPEELLKSMQFNAPGCYYMLLGRGASGANHQVVCLNDKVVHDPSITSRGGLVGPCDDGWTWVSFITHCI